MRYFYKYIKIKALQAKGFVTFYRDEYNSFIICDKFGYPIQANTKEDTLRLARLAIDDLNGKR